MNEERTITQSSRIPVQRLWWSAIFGGTFFALGVIVIFGLFGLAIGAAASGPAGVTSGVQIWAGIWSLVTMFVAFFAGGWLAAKSSGSPLKADGRLHGIVVWALGTVALSYFVLNTTRMAALLGSLTGSAQAVAAPVSLENMTVTAASWMLIAAICGLIGGIAGGQAAGYSEVISMPIRRAA